MIKKILVPLDGSDLAERALVPAEELVRALGGSMVLLTVIRGSDLKFVRVERLDEASRGMVMEYLRPISSRLLDAGIPVECRVEFGEPADVIAAVARKAHTDLIIMSTHGAGSTGRYAFGSVALKVLQAAPCAVTMIRAPDAAEPHP